MSLQGRYLHAMGITRWARRELSSVEPEAAKPVLEEVQPNIRVEDEVADPVTRVAEKAAPVILDVSHSGWDELQQVVSECRKCSLADGRTKTVFGTGDRKADWLIIGEAPGEQEDRQGEPFVGRAGVLLTNMIKAVGFEREAVYIANVVKCRPPRNRDPQSDEVVACSSYLKRQIALLQPKLVLVVGRVAAQHLLGTSDAVGKMRGKLHHYPGTETPLIVTYHPAYLLRRPIEKRKSWDDLRFAMSTYQALQD